MGKIGPRYNLIIMCSWGRPPTQNGLKFHAIGLRGIGPASRCNISGPKLKTTKQSAWNNVIAKTSRMSISKPPFTRVDERFKDFECLWASFRSPKWDPPAKWSGIRKLVLSYARFPSLNSSRFILLYTNGMAFWVVGKVPPYCKWLEMSLPRWKNMGVRWHRLKIYICSRLIDETHITAVSCTLKDRRATSQ
jgi:hypothetical protein